MKEVPLLALIECIYSDEPDQKSWNETLFKLCQLIDAQAAALFIVARQGKAIRVLGQHGFSSHFMPANCLVSCEIGTHIQSTLRYQNVYSKRIEEDTYDTHLYDVTTHSTQQKIMSGIHSWKLYGNDQFFIGIEIHRDNAKPLFSIEEIDYLNCIYKHLKRVFEASEMIKELRQKDIALSSALSRVSQGVVVVDANLNIIYTNKVADILLLNNLGLAVTDNKLHATSNANQAVLQCHVQRIIEHGIPSLSIQFKEEEQTYPLVISFHNTMPLPEANKPLSNRAVLYISQLGTRSFATKESLQTAYQLTAAEAHIALSIADGLTLKDIAESKSISVQTVRSQLKIVFHKMGVNSQTDLARSILTSAYNLSL